MPGALPSIVTGLSIGMGTSWFSLVTAEMISGQFAIGYYTWEAYTNLASELSPGQRLGAISARNVGIHFGEGQAAVEAVRGIDFRVEASIGSADRRPAQLASSAPRSGG